MVARDPTVSKIDADCSGEIQDSPANGFAIISHVAINSRNTAFFSRNETFRPRDCADEAFFDHFSSQLARKPAVSFEVKHYCHVV